MNTTSISNQNNYFAHTREQKETVRFGDVLATTILVSYTAVALIISAWSAIVFKYGNIESGGPIGLLFHAIRTSVIG